MTDARSVTFELGGRWHGRYGTAPCPVCQSERRSDQSALTLTNRDGGGLLLHCKKLGCDFRDILAAAGICGGDWHVPDACAAMERRANAQAVDEKRSAQARKTWQDAQPIARTRAEAYLRGRAITCELPDTLRFHPKCWHASACRAPALVALVEGTGGFAVHRTYLAPDGSGKASVDPQKAMLGPTAGGAVRLLSEPGPLVVAEGIETGLSLLCGLLGVPATVWAALSTSGMRALRLPSKPGRLTVTADGDPAGFEAAHALAKRAHGLGWRVSLLPASDGCD